jgi:hydrogenase maturation protease
VRITNTTPWPQGETVGQGRSDAVRQTFVSTHTILRVQAGAFVSLLEPPPALQAAAEACANLKTWPVLVGDDGERHTLLSSPIILYDYPRVSPESPGDLFDATEIDELLRLSIMTLTDEEKREMRESDARGREILERTESLSQDHLMQLHAAVRSVVPSRGGER